MGLKWTPAGHLPPLSPDLGTLLPRHTARQRSALTRTLTGEQVTAAKAAFCDLRERRFLPFDQIDEDPARAELDRRLLVDVLGLPETLCEPDGSMDLLRRKLAQEPQIHDGKQTRVVFYETIGGSAEQVSTEGSEPRPDR